MQHLVKAVQNHVGKSAMQHHYPFRRQIEKKERQTKLEERAEVQMLCKLRCTLPCNLSSDYILCRDEKH